MRVVSSPNVMARLAAAWRSEGVSVGFVPTMGALHAGHLSLLKRARRENKVLVASIFVNPTQFGPKEDLSRYPRPFTKDAALCRAAGVDVLFHPTPEGLYPAGFGTWVEVPSLSASLCGPFRPGHFRGVATVVAKLFGLVLPARAYFGAKDFQQLAVIRRMTEDLNLPVRVVGCPTVREKDGLAMSSRNAYLSPAERAAAAGVPAALRAAAQVIKFFPKGSVGQARRAATAALAKIPGARVQYVEVVDPATLAPLRRPARPALVAAAVYVGGTRLIDNILIP
jgi:pantoate--beta-alanine ligase